MSAQSFDYGAWVEPGCKLPPGDGYVGPPEPMRVEAGVEVAPDHCPDHSHALLGLTVAINGLAVIVLGLAVRRIARLERRP